MHFPKRKLNNWTKVQPLIISKTKHWVLEGEKKKKKIPVKVSPVSTWEQDAMFPRSGPIYYLSSESQPDLSENGKEDISKIKMDVTSYFSRDQTIC